MNGVERIVAERKRQIEVEGWTLEHDDIHANAELVLAAVCYASPAPLKAKLSYIPISNCGCHEAACPHAYSFPVERWVDPWPWDKQWDKREQHNYLRRLEIAGALIAAEIDRLLRKRGAR